MIVGCGGTPADTNPSPKDQPDAVEAKVPVKDLKASYETTKKAYLAAKSDTTKSPYVAATVGYATAVMAGDGKPSEKYPLSLKLYDEALGVDP